MNKYKNHDFRQKLEQLISDIESESQIELVVIIKPRSAYYSEIKLYYGLLSSLSVLAYLLLINFDFNDIEIFVLTVLAFLLGSLIGLIPNLQRLLIKKSDRGRNAEIMARALFQKGELYNTHTQIATLIYCSLFEKSVYILKDRGAQIAIPDAEWQKIDIQFQTIFRHRQPQFALLEQLKNCQPIFKQYLPALADNINELPNDLDLEI
jgi:putative membrane protein